MSQTPEQFQPTGAQPGGEGQPRNDPTKFFENVAPHSVGTPTEEPRPRMPSEYQRAHEAVGEEPGGSGGESGGGSQPEG